MKTQTFAVAAAIVSIVACGSSSKGGGEGPGDDAGADVVAPVEASNGNEGSAGDDGGDAAPEPPDDGPWPAPHYPLPLFTNLAGGPVLAKPELVAITFVGNPNRDALRTFGEAFAEGTTWWSKVTAGYSIGAATAGTPVELPDTVSNTTLNDDNGDVANFVGGLVTAGTLPPPDGNQVFVIYYPSTTTITFQGSQSCGTATTSGFGGYHSMAEITTDGGTQVVTYAVIADCGGQTAAQELASLQDTVSHEFIEASTDPYASKPAWGGYQLAWFRSGPTPVELEVADACESYTPFTDSNGYTLARSWVNQEAQASSDPCQPELPGEIFYDVAVPTTSEVPSTPGFTASDGYVVVPAGTTKTVDCVFFSEAKLPNDAQIQVGGRGAKGATALNPTIETGVTASVTPTAAHNGMHVTLTIQADATATNGDFNVRARSILKTGDSHDWPFILRITGGVPPSDGGTPKDAGGGG